MDAEYWYKKFKKMRNKADKYEKALFNIAQFGAGGRGEKGEITVDGSYDEPGCAETARKALGKKYCKQFKSE